MYLLTEIILFVIIYIKAEHIMKQHKDKKYLMKIIITYYLVIGYIINLKPT